jgi:hypothetical protein
LANCPIGTQAPLKRRMHPNHADPADEVSKHRILERSLQQ